MFHGPRWRSYVVAIVVICTPGQDTALTIRNTLAGGRRTGLGDRRRDRGAGIRPSGRSPRARAWSRSSARRSRSFAACSSPEPAYLVYLGVQSLVWALSADGRTRHDVAGPRTRLTPSRGYRQGLLSNLGNPKMAVFFASLLPSSPRRAVARSLALLGSASSSALMTLAWLTLYVVVVAGLEAASRPDACAARSTPSPASSWSRSGSVSRPRSASARARSGARRRGAPCSSSPPRRGRRTRAHRRRSGSRGRRGS